MVRARVTVQPGDFGQMERNEQRVEKTWHIWQTENSCTWEFAWGLSASLLVRTPRASEYAKGETRLGLTWQTEHRSSSFGERPHTSVTRTWFYQLATLQNSSKFISRRPSFLLSQPLGALFTEIPHGIGITRFHSRWGAPKAGVTSHSSTLAVPAREPGCR